jgi:rRNA maturation RNase YbeY
LDDDPYPPRLQILLTQDSCIGAEKLRLEVLERCAGHLLDLCKDEGQGLGVGLHVCGQEEMARLHGQFMGDPTPTDVMAFDGDDFDPDYLGDVVVCWDVAQEEATSHGHSDLIELQFYVMHGILHLLGYDDDTPEKRSEMHELQKEAMRLEKILVQS